MKFLVTGGAGKVAAEGEGAIADWGFCSRGVLGRNLASGPGDDEEAGRATKAQKSTAHHADCELNDSRGTTLKPLKNFVRKTAQIWPSSQQFPFIARGSLS